MNGVMCFRRTTLMAIFALTLSACAPQAQTMTPTSTSSPPSPVPITVTPTLAASLPSPAIVRPSTGELHALGIIGNQAPTAVTDLDVSVKFLAGQAGDLLSEVRVRPLLPYLPAGESSPFTAPFQGAGSPEAVQAEVLRYAEWSGEAADVEISPTRALPVAESRTRVVGYLETQAGSAVQIDGMEAVVLDQVGSPTGLAESVAGPIYLSPRSRVPFQAILPGRVPLSFAKIFLAASMSQSRPPSNLAVELEPGWQTDPQGNPFLLGTAHNQGETAQTGDILLSFHRGPRLLGVVTLEASIPLTPGELRPFAVHNPPLLRGSRSGEVQVEVYAQPPPEPASETTPVPLGVQVTVAEGLGSRVFLRGHVTNEQSHSVTEPTLFAALRATDGSLWSAAWHSIGDELRAGEQHDFVLSLPLPEGVELPLGEFDLRALGLTSR